MDLGIKGKRALVCGGSKGLGYGSAEALAREDVDICILGREQSTLTAAVERLKKLGRGGVRGLKCDLLAHNDRQQVIAEIAAEWGSLDILIHNVGGPKPTSVQETSAEAWQEGFDRLFLPVVEFNHAFIPGMQKNSWGRIVTVTSLSVTEPIANLAVSNAVRSASVSMSKTLSDEVAPHGITVNCVAPGIIATDRIHELTKTRIGNSGKTVEEYQAEQSKSIPVGRYGRVDEYGAAVAFLCSQQASYITGSTLYVDGGKRRSTY